MSDVKGDDEEVYGKVMDHVDRTGETLREAFMFLGDTLPGLTPSKVQQHYYRHKRTLNPRLREKLPSEYGGYTQLDDDASGATNYEKS